MHLLARNPERTTHLEQSFLVQRRGMSIVAAIFPLMFLVSSFVMHHTDFQASISAYYWTEDFERNFFVGALSAIAVFLLLYKGYTALEDRMLDLAGVCALGVAFCPMNEAMVDCKPPLDGQAIEIVVTTHGMF